MNADTVRATFQLKEAQVFVISMKDKQYQAHKKARV